MAAVVLVFAVTNVRFFFDSFPGALPGQAEIYLDHALVLRLHIVTGTLAIVVGPMQFWSGFRDRHRKWHRRLGKIYLTGVAIGSPTALYVAWISYGGLPTHISFTLLALVWGGTTLMAYRRIRARNWRSHREWMIRSYSCALGILAMRAWLGVFARLGGVELEEAQIASVWLGWVLNLLIAEMYIGWWRHRKTVDAVPESIPAQSIT